LLLGLHRSRVVDRAHERDGIAVGAGGLQETGEYRSGSADAGETMQVNRFGPAQSAEQLVEEDRQAIRVSGPAEVRDREAENLERGPRVRRDELRGHLVIGEQAGDRRDPEVCEGGDAVIEWARGPRPADEPAFRWERRVDDRDHGQNRES
jgi:hypothetical protein